MNYLKNNFNRVCLNIYYVISLFYLFYTLYLLIDNGYFYLFKLINNDQIGKIFNIENNICITSNKMINNSMECYINVLTNSTIKEIYVDDNNLINCYTKKIFECYTVMINNKNFNINFYTFYLLDGINILIQSCIHTYTMLIFIILVLLLYVYIIIIIKLLIKKMKRNNKKFNKIKNNKRKFSECSN